MLLGLLAALAVAPLYWLLVPARFRREALVVASLGGLWLYDPRVVVLVVVVVLGLFGLMRALAGARDAGRAPLVVLGLAALAGLFLFNKLAGQQLVVLPSQSGLAFLGVSYLVLKAAAALIETARGTLRDFTVRDVLLWIVFLPAYPSGPMEDFEHFRRQAPAFDRGLVLPGLERILVGLVKALLGAHYLGEWAAPLLAAPESYGRGMLLLGLYASALRFYLDFSGYSDIAIGLGAVFGYEIEENFDHPFIRRNLAQLWQHWHMTLTRWLRLYLFVPVSRRLLRRRSRWGDVVPIAAGQIVAMTFCGLWHGLAWNFALWGLLQALGLIWVGVYARPLGRRLPEALVAWWRDSWSGYAISTTLTFTFFALAIIFVMTDTSSAIRYLRFLVWP
jgi:alginate O-acetyltransferase complex protein AlgI